MRSRLALAALAVGLTAGPGSAQDWRDVTSFRQRAGESRLDVHVRYGAGKLLIQPGTGGELYRVGMRYDSDVFDPITQYRDGRLEVGVEGRGRGLNLKNSKAGELKLTLTRDVPLELDLDFGAVEADLELGGLRIASLDIETGASETDIRFSEPNPVSCDRLEISLGAAAFEAEGLGNLGCEVVDVEGGVGEITLDFSGEWRRDAHANLTMALGSVTLVVPGDVGVRIDKDTFLTDFDGQRFTKRSGVYYSDGWENAARRLDVDLEGAFGAVNVRWSRASGPTP
ncbi:MAG: hypothetical protein GWM90_11845 [Gemmatimonadetes bacterium]|nr:hypothetical protein [Gemmatimonadota bacterium]NIQ54687.1 hypothetical protein [Gemmatimonadota bacterium]NIU74895.1 hypothetical protein [Gammaproteobacteria bacterium]NIX44783.1 hypothetical protein [Gemmatimonadota bacterium]NIY09021.1 hypothetical protein [Gemmatimonadota bacterium]